MREKKNFDYNDYFEFAMYALAVICMVYFMAKGNLAKTLEPFFIIVILAVLKLVHKRTKVHLFPALRFSVLLFMFITMFLANEFGFYSKIPYLDKIEHLYSGIILCFVGILLYKQISRMKDANQLFTRTSVYFSLFFSVAMAGCWEIYEFTGDQLFGLNSQNGSLIDTMTDIICGTIGAVLTSLWLFYFKVREHGEK